MNKVSEKSAQPTPQSARALMIATIIAILFAGWFLRGYFSMLVIAGTLAYLYYPLYEKFTKKMSPNSAAALTLLTGFASIFAPLAIVITLTVAQLSGIASSVTPFFSSLDTGAVAEKIVTQINYLSSYLPFDATLMNSGKLLDASKQLVINIGGGMVNAISSSFGSIFGLFMAVIIFFYVFISLLKNGPVLINLFKKINPLGDDLSAKYISKVGAMIKGTVRGQFAIAVVQGLLGAIAFWIAGFGDLFFAIFTIFTLLSVIPLGAGILAIPAGVAMIIFGNFWGGLIVILEHVLINTNVDNVLRPILVPKEAKLDPALMLVSVFAGIGMFGFLGIIIGPTLMIVIVTTIKAYATHVQQNNKTGLTSRGTQ
jgi:predicted PurR-regulated permease PerM